MRNKSHRENLTTNRVIAVVDELERSHEVLTQSLLNAKQGVRVSLKARIARIEDLLRVFGQMLEENGEAEHA